LTSILGVLVDVHAIIRRGTMGLNRQNCGLKTAWSDAE